MIDKKDMLSYTIYIAKEIYNSNDGIMCKARSETLEWGIFYVVDSLNPLEESIEKAIESVNNSLNACKKFGEQNVETMIVNKDPRLNVLYKKRFPVINLIK